MPADHFSQKLSRHVWDTKYRHRDGDAVLEESVEDSWRRVARSAAGAASPGRASLEEDFYRALFGFRFLPAGRILAGAGTAHRVTLFNCFVMGVIDDCMDGIFDALKEGAVTMQQGGGVGYDFSTLRPKGSRARTTGTLASGPVSFMRIWDSMCATVLSTGARRGAMMATLRCDHPDIQEFVDAKRDSGALRNFNVSVQVTDEFMEAVHRDEAWQLVFPLDDDEPADSDAVVRWWPGRDDPYPCRVYQTIPARKLWAGITRAAYDYAEPGVLFVDRINRLNNLGYRERITATNPCGEQPLPPYGACNLGSINLTRFIENPFTAEARLDYRAIGETAATATRLLDSVIDLSRFPLEKQADQARGSRRIGLGMTGLADALIMLNLHYDSDEARAVARTVMQTVCHCAYRTSIDLARERGAFPFFDRDAYVAGEFIGRLPEDIRAGIAEHGIRNSHLTSIAPAGTISLLANNVSSGIEPVFELSYERRVLDARGEYETHEVNDFAFDHWQRHCGGLRRPDYFVTARELSPRAHLAMQFALQPFVDSAISKTVNVPRDFPHEEFASLYSQAFDLGLKGCTAFRPNPVTGSILAAHSEQEGAHAPYCCGIEREAD